MTVDDVQRVLDEIRQLAGPQTPGVIGDDESAHIKQDRLFRAVLRAIADGDYQDNPGALAAEALKVDDIEFSRWYA